MTCSSCGSTLNADVRFCTHCGAGVIPASQTNQTAQVQPVQSAWQVPPVPVYAAMPGIKDTRVARHIQAAGILWIVYAIYRTGSKLIGLAVLHGIFGSHFHSGMGSSWDLFGASVFWPMIVVSLVTTLALCLLTGYALLTRQPWTHHRDHRQRPCADPPGAGNGARHLHAVGAGTGGQWRGVPTAHGGHASLIARMQ
jgi:hypothetical protein